MDTPPSHVAPSGVVKPSNGHQLVPGRKEQRYDRQLRLWAASGQAALESAHILLVNGTATGASILKNLVLPGVGAFTILDAATVTGADLGNNFFLQPGTTNEGDSRAEHVAKYLSELNDSVASNFLQKTVAEFLSTSPASLAPYTLVITVDTSPEETLQLSDRCWDATIPIIAVKSCGFIGSVRTQIKEAGFIETHPENPLVDLRLDAPFPELANHVESIDFDALDSLEYAHIPPLVIILKAIEAWKASHNCQLPLKTSEKKELKQMIQSMKRGGPGADHENFDEAVNMVNKYVKKTEIPAEIKTLFNDPACENISTQSTPFWLLLRAVRNFVRSEFTNDGQNLLPYNGAALPDMKATSAGFRALQTLYRGKAASDLAAVKAELAKLLQDVGSIDENLLVDDEQIIVFVKNVASLHLARGRRMRDEYERPDQKRIRIAFEAASQPDPFDTSETPEAVTSAIHYYLALRAADHFYLEHSRWPGSLPEQVDVDGLADLEGITESVRKVLTVCLGESQLRVEVDDLLEKALAEVTRAGGAVLPQIAALLGGIVAQEAIKLITTQYIPLNGTFIFDGIRSKGQSFDF